jgi:hypothetical protein
MPKYFFDVVNGEGWIRDDEGIELPNSDAMRAEVARIAIDVAKDEIADQNAMAVTVNVRDDTDSRVFSGRLSFKTEWYDPNDGLARGGG